MINNTISEINNMISKIILEEKVQQAKNWIDKSENIVIISHVNPDGDAIGSSLAMYHFLFSISKNVTVIVPDSIPPFLTWMSGSKEVLIYNKMKEEADEKLAKADLIMALDLNTINRVGRMADAVDLSPAKKILVDHHPNPGGFCQLVISHPEICSTAEMVFRLICRMGHFSEINLPCAECIYVGMMTDTGAFTYNSNNTEVYVIIAELIKKGINKDAIYNNVYNTYSADRFRLMGLALNKKMKIYPEYKAALITLTNEEQTEYNFRKGDCEGFVNIPLSIDGIIFSAFFRQDDEKIRISFRSQGTFPVNKFSAENFNGGGHLNAAGGESLLSMEETIQKFESILPKYKEFLEEYKKDENK